MCDPRRLEALTELSATEWISFYRPDQAISNRIVGECGGQRKKSISSHFVVSLVFAVLRAFGIETKPARFAITEHQIQMQSRSGQPPPIQSVPQISYPRDIHWPHYCIHCLHFVQSTAILFWGQLQSHINAALQSGLGLVGVWIVEETNTSTQTRTRQIILGPIFIY